MDNYIFSGIGFAPAQYITKNKDIEAAIENGILEGFNSARLRQSEKYQNLLKEGMELSPFEYLAEQKMGFRDRVHVVPFPPIKKSYKKSENTLDLCVKASEEAISDAGISPDEIDAWIVSTGTAHEMAPGLAATLKCYFVPFSNQSQTMTLTSACVGFNINIERAINMMQSNPEMQHVLVAHTEVMSEMLLEENDFVPATTFGDASAAVILSKVQSDKKEGIICIKNYEDLRMIDFLGAHRNGNLYMEPRVVKSRAVPNMIKVVKEICDEISWNNNSYDKFIPHQTGHAIVHSVAEAVGVPEEKLFQEVQLKYGNLSGSSVPSCFYLLKNRNELKPGMNILTAVAGLGGEYGGFAYIVPEINKKNTQLNRLKDKKVFITGATGDLASEVAKKCLTEGAQAILHYRKDGKKLENLKNKLKNWEDRIQYVRADLSKKEEIENMISEVKSKNENINYLLISAANTGSLNRASDVTQTELNFVEQINHRSPQMICDELEDLISESIILVGSVAEDALFSGSSAYVSSKKALHAYSIDLASRMYKKSVRVIYYMPGIINGGMASKLSPAQAAMSMQSIGQKELIPLDKISDRIFKSMFLPKVQGVESNYESALVVRRDGFIKE